MGLFRTGAKLHRRKELLYQLSAVPEMNFGNMPNDGGHLLLDLAEAADAIRNFDEGSFIHPFIYTARKEFHSRLGKTMHLGY